MRGFIYILVIGLFIYSCGSSQKTIKKNNSAIPEGAVKIANDSLAYEIIIFDVGYDTYLSTKAKPDWYYSQKYLEAKNKFYVTEWNIRVRNPRRYNPNIYENSIDYNPNINYGLEVNYKLYNYFKFVEYKYHQIFR